MLKLVCKKCGKTEVDFKLDLHHLLPKCTKGTDRDGRIWLCIDCHKDLHKEIYKATVRWLGYSDIIGD